MVSWWPGDGNAEDISDANNGELNGGMGFAAGKVSNAFQFDGVDDYVRIASAANLDVGAGDGFTMDAWINPSDVSNQLPLIEYNSGGIFGPHLWTSAEAGSGAGSLFANIVDTSQNFHMIFSDPGLLTEDAWQHVALTYDKTSGIATLYLDGQIVASEDLGSFTPETTVDLYFGVRPFGAAAGLHYPGLMDEVELLDRILSQTEIQAIYDADSAGKCKYVLSLFEGTDPSDLVLNLGQEARAVAETNDPVVTQVEFRWIDPSANIETEIVPLTLGSAESTFTPNEVGMWEVEADFGNGVVIRETLHIDFFVVPESTIGVIALVGSSLAALGVFVLRKKHGTSHNRSINDLGI